jgi:D-alanyl-D-alanine carboxypeptidase
MKRILLLAAAPLLFGLDQQDLIAGLEQEAQRYADKDEFSGTLLVARDGKVIFQKAYGLANRESATANTLDTKFRIGSMNKLFTAVSMLQLVERGKAGLDDPIAKHWPDYPNKDVASKVTIRHLLTHTGGTGDIFGPQFDANRLELRSLADYAKLYGSRGPQFEPGSDWRYSNYGYLLLGLLIERISGKSYYDYVRENIYEPSGMKSSESEFESVKVTGRSTGYRKHEGKWVSNAETLPVRGTSAGGGYTTAGDLYRFSQALASGKLLKRELLEMATTKQVTPKGAPPFMGYGFGNIVIGDSYGHGGGAPGMNAELRIYPKEKLVFVALANLDPPAAGRLDKWFRDKVLTK